MNLESILGLISAFGLGTIFSTIIQLYFENRRVKIERKSELNKEIYFKKVEAWEKISHQMMILETEVTQYIKVLSGGQFFLAKLDVLIGDRIKDLSGIGVWFSKDVKDAWNKIDGPYNTIHKTYLLAREGKMTTEQANECVEAIGPFNKVMTQVREKITKELELEKEKII